MKFLLSGKLEYFEHLGKDGVPGDEIIAREFEAVDVETAIGKAKEITKTIIKKYNGDSSCGGKELEALSVALNVIYPVWKAEIDLSPRKKLKETYYDYVG